jgi:hypothetical protein
VTSLTALADIQTASTAISDKGFDISTG